MRVGFEPTAKGDMRNDSGPMRVASEHSVASDSLTESWPWRRADCDENSEQIYSILFAHLLLYKVYNILITINVCNIPHSSVLYAAWWISTLRPLGSEAQPQSPLGIHLQMPHS